jgi:hypothetical protein
VSPDDQNVDGASDLVHVSRLMDGADPLRGFQHGFSRSLAHRTFDFANAEILMATPRVGTFLLPFTKLKPRATPGQSNG